MKMQQQENPAAVAWIAVAHFEDSDDVVYGATRAAVEGQVEARGWPSAITEIAPLYARPAPAPLPEGAAPRDWPAVRGIGRDNGHSRALCIYFDDDPTDDQMRAVHRALRDAPAPLPEGMVLVPREPTIDMVEFGSSEVMKGQDFERAKNCWRAMIAASPGVQGQGGQPSVSCDNCGMAVPPGCDGGFRDDGDECKLNGQAGEAVGKPSWDDAPEWAQWLAQDENGPWWWHKAEPYRAFGRWLSGFQNTPAGNGPANPNWRDTLEQRPAQDGDDKGER